MAIDGNFSLEAELLKFIKRCPELDSIGVFHYLLKKGDNLTEEEVVNAVGEVFLHPKYTIPLIGCFRPIAKKIVDRAVSLLRLVPDLSSNSEDSVIEINEDKFLRQDEFSIIDVYITSKKGLDLHEVACLAYCRALDLIPLLLGSVLSYFEFAPPPFQRIKLRESVVEDLPMLSNAVKVSYRFYLAEPEVFTTLWDWSCFLGLMKQVMELGLAENTELCMDFNDIRMIRWCWIQILKWVLKLSDIACETINFASEEEFKCLTCWKTFCEEISLEKASWYLGSSAESVDIDSFNNNSLLSNSTNIGYNIRPFVLTSAIKKSYEMVFLAVSQRWPVLLYGPAGMGKTALIQNLAENHGSKVLCIHMDEQIDGKTLLGSTVCTDTPGEFKWQPGSLTQAVYDGFWVVFEDIDNAPPDIQSILLPLLEGATSFSTGHGEAIRVSEGFRLFSTVTSSKLDIPNATEGRNALGALWRRVVIGLSSKEDLDTIVHAWYPQLDHLKEKLIETFDRVNKLAGPQFGASTSFNNRFSLRDLLKWCKRIVGLGFEFYSDTPLSTYMLDSIYKEAIDVFAAFSTKIENRISIMKELANIWKVSGIETLYPLSKPTIQESRSELRIGRVALQHNEMNPCHKMKPFVEIHISMHILERIASSVKYNEPVLLVGETGTGKTTLVQNLATRLGQKLTVLNLSQQSDAADLLGGFKPRNAQFVCYPLYEEFENLFSNTFSLKDNEKFIINLRKSVDDKNWKKLIKYCRTASQMVSKLRKCGSDTKRKRCLSPQQVEAWGNFNMKLDKVDAQINASSGMVFSFVEGAFIKALKNGEWILLDEVNLAPPETLQRVIGVLEEEKGSLCLAERGDVEYITRNPNFRIFACMNPANDAGKRDLPCSLRCRFTEYFVDDLLNDEDLMMFISQFLDDNSSNRAFVSKIMDFYKDAKKKAEESLQDGANMKPQYSLRSLYRALEYTGKGRREFGFEKALYDGFCMFFLTLLDEPSARIMNQLISKWLLSSKIPQPSPFDAYSKMKKNSAVNNNEIKNYVLTKSVKEHLRNLARAIFVGRYPVLLQGPTSSGKTSLVQYLASITGHEFVRINNHEHTDLQEYLGSYITDSTGKLTFHEGALVRAVRNGYWIVLDELNLAPSDVLEALNRLLDDNRELFIPELNETVRAHPEFMLFATQNPPTLYGGRKILSRAFRNRFVEIHVEEIPQDELSTILEKRCEIPESYAKKMVDVMKELQLQRQSSKIFAGKHGFITPRDLFRWANRFNKYGTSYEDLARDGYFLMAERLRDDNEKLVVQQVLEKILRVKLSIHDMYKKEGDGLEVEKYPDLPEDLGRIIWTKSMWRLYFLVKRCYNMREPVLLVGETGGGKTTVCQMLSCLLRSKLHILNCHQHTETSDFLGGFYPVRDRSEISIEFKKLCLELMNSSALVHFPGDTAISTDITQASATITKLSDIILSYKQGTNVTIEDINVIEQLNQNLRQLYQKWQTIGAWQDGPLVEAMKKGDMLLVDEISLADDSVLERLNSVLETERKLSLAEKGGSVLEKLTAHENFFILATMNPGGDYGKKELSPALRNRFTEIWVPAVIDVNELKSIAVERVSNPQLKGTVDVLLSFWEWFNQLLTGRLLTVRDLLSWVSFMNVAERRLKPESAFLHGAFLVLLDGLSLGTSLSKKDAAELRKKCLSFLLEQLKEYQPNFEYEEVSSLECFGWAEPGRSVSVSVSYPESLESDKVFGIHPFYIDKGPSLSDAKGFEFLAPTTRRNALRVVRAMQLVKPVLLEGSPGVGKTSLVVALGKYSGHTVVRINLSEQTDMMDLLGSDLPVESGEGVQFAWSDGILLQAVKNGSWVLLDELNLAPQSVLEGLNAILDHRAEVFIPELGRSFKCPSSFRVFACQNPSSQGGGRKGLPRSFLNRFTKVYIDELGEDDYLAICQTLYPSISETILLKLVLFNRRLHEDTMLHKKFAQLGSPWEFNLRDVIRSCEIIQGSPEISKLDCFLNTVYVQRMRTSADRKEVIKLYEEIFGPKLLINPHPRVQLNPSHLIIGNVSVERNSKSFGKSVGDLKILPSLRQNLEAVAYCVKHQWLCIVVGPASSGKTSLIRLLAQLTGNVLHELSLSSATDISDLLGSFEQYNAFRNYRLLIGQVERYINEYRSLKLEDLIERNDLISKWVSFLSIIESPTMTKSTSVETWRSRYFDSIPLLVEIIERMRLDLDESMLSVSWSMKDLHAILMDLRKLNKDYKNKSHSSRFEWVAGVLIKAIENGDWIVLENANLCNPTVLDRINSLVEQSGSITVNECGLVNGQPVILHPHRNFRMFLTVNPAYGEVSRAMRNRGVETFIMQPYWHLDENFSQQIEEFEFEDVKMFLTLSGISIASLVDKMAKAHIYAKHEGAKLHVSITYLELGRWVQLFQRLVTNGNQPIWSLKISWEHTYLSSLGEGEGKAIVSHETLSLSSSQDQDRLLNNWPNPLTVRDFVCYSMETSVRQNCLYLEVIAMLCGPCLMDSRMLRALKNYEPTCFNGETGLDTALAQKMLLFAANWTIEQAMESDFKLYLLWFKNFGSQLRLGLSSMLSIMEREVKHPIWNQILNSRQKVIDSTADVTPIPILSTELIDMAESVNERNSYSLELRNLIKAEELLRLSYSQYVLEKAYNYDKKSQGFKPVLKSLRRVEKKMFELFVKSTCLDVDVPFQLYNNLLEHHVLLWKVITSSWVEHLTLQWKGITLSWVECLVISLRALVKDSVKIHTFCPSEVDIFQKEIKKIEEGIKKLYKISFSSVPSQKSLLWAYGGHPYLPPCADLYKKHTQLLELCEVVWPRSQNLMEISESDILITGALSFNSELRVLAMQGVCMSSYIMGKGKEHDLDVIHQLEEMREMLVKRVDFEKTKLQEFLQTNEQEDLIMSEISACCSFSSDMLCRRNTYDSLLETLPLIDSTSIFLDAQLLDELSKISLLDFDKQCHALSTSSTSTLVESSMRFSLNHSSRPPTDFTPHQKILWTLDAQAVNINISSFTIEMWSRWHQSLWKPCSAFSETSNILLPDWLFQPVKMTAVEKILQSTVPVKEHPVQRLKFRGASNSLWQVSPTINNVYGFLLSTARSIFQNIIQAHQKSFSHEKYANIKSTLEKIVSEQDIKHLVSLLSSSKHQKFKSLLVNDYTKLLLGKLFLNSSSDDSKHSVGCVWLWIGWLHYHLLVCCDDVDPAVKYSIKYLHLQERISLLELENEVREACLRVSGCFRMTEAKRSQMKLLEHLQSEAKTLQRKVVFRSDPGMFRKLKDEFHQLYTTFSDWEILKSMDMTETENFSKIENWQKTITCFIDRLSVEYSSYSDVIEPVQVSLYEMKLGLSLIHSSTLSKELLLKLNQPDMESVLGTVYSLIRFPKGCPSGDVSFKVVNTSGAKLSSTDIEMPKDLAFDSLNLLETLVTFGNYDKTESNLRLKTSMYRNVLVKAIHYISEVRFMDNSLFMLFDKIFDEFGKCWMDMKLKSKPKEDNESQQFKFRPHVFKLENIIEIDESLWEDEEFSKSVKDEEEVVVDETLEEDWSFLEDSLLKDMVDIHNQLFALGGLHVSDSDKISTFIDSYTLGTGIVNDLKGVLMSGLDSSIVPEHLLRICLEHEHKFESPRKLIRAYNFYKDSNPPFMVKMVEPLKKLKQRILFHLKEWDDHSSLQRIVDVLDKVLAMHLSTPLAKALSGLELVLYRVQMLQETVAKFPLSDQLKPIFDLVSSWHKLEFESWDALLDEVNAQFNTNAGKLWFPLYSVLNRKDSDDTLMYNLSTIQSINDFILKSSIGEFKKRLELLLAFHGHITNKINRGCQEVMFKETQNILFNTFGFYMQFLPIILTHLETSRKSIEKELKDLVKLRKWERIDSYIAVESLRKTRPKLKKIINKYTELLNQPVLFFLGKEPVKGGIHVQSREEDANVEIDSLGKNKNLLDSLIDQTKLEETNRLPWFVDWQKKVEFVRQSIEFDNAVESYTIIEKSIDPISECLLERRKHIWGTVENICTTVSDCSELWKEEKKKQGKMRVFSELLKLLGSCGLTRHRATSMENDLNINTSSWILQPSYNVHHLFLHPDENSLKNLSHDKNLEIEWKSANQYYFKSISSVKNLHERSQKFQDFTLEQVQRSVSYVYHLIEIQQDQREAAYNLAKQLKCLKEYMWPLANLLQSSYTQNQHINFYCMWQQKQIFDSLCTMIYEECLLLQRVEDTHSATCQTVKDSAKFIRLFIEKFVPDVQKSKDLLDNYLLGSNQVTVTVGAVLPPYGVTKQMELLIDHNFQLLRSFKDSIHTFQRQSVNSGAVETTLFGHFDEIFKKADSVAEKLNLAMSEAHGENSIEVEAGFNEALKGAYTHIMDLFRTIGSQEYANGFSEDSLRNITIWKDLFVTDITQLKLTPLCDDLEKAITFAGKLLNCVSESEIGPVEAQLRQLYLLLDVILSFGDGLLHDFLVTHRMVSVMSHVLADTFTSLFGKGFGVPDDPTAENGDEKTKDASGTGMGEGAGIKDVSDQIEDEDQLLGTEKTNEDEKGLPDPNKNVKGVEMEQDFEGDTFSVSEESGDDNEEEEDNEEEPQVDSAMGETGENGDIVDEKLCDKEDENDDNTPNEKYETGPAVKDVDVDGRELRAKDDSEIGGEEPEPDELNQDNNNNTTQDDDEEGKEGNEEEGPDKDDAFADPSGLKLDDPNQDINMDEAKEEDTKDGESEPSKEDNEAGPMEDVEPGGTDLDPMEEDGAIENLESEENGNNGDEVAEDSEMANLENEQDKDKDLTKQRKNSLQMGASNFSEDNVQTAHQSGAQPKGDSDSAGFQDTAPEAMHSEYQNDLAPSSGVPNASGIETMVSDLQNGKNISENQPSQMLPPSESSSLQKMQPNPFRNVGDALEGWKDRVKVSFDLEDNDLVNENDDNADEYGYTAEFEKGTAQALGPATTEQMDSNVNTNDMEKDSENISDVHEEHHVDEMEHDMKPSETPQPVRNSVTLNNNNNTQKSDLEGEQTDVHSKENSENVMSMQESVVSMERLYMDEDINVISTNHDDEEMGKANTLAVLDDIRDDDDAASLWRKYELSTSRLSDELAEQLRLVMDPTKANKLQGDYKTGKRINMKRLIRYVASDFQNDKIWLRRTRPNKRDYQVVIAVDDSRSMSESGCGDVAVEALVMVCKAMSKLDVGDLAITSYGKKGNIRLLHDFDQSFNGEAGVKMVSSLSFKQENTIADEPMVDLLKYLNNMLEGAVVNARLPCGHNPLQQLVLIIADGRFHEKKEILRRYVRDLMSKKRMVAFVLMDSPEESIMDLKEPIFQGENVKFANYLDSFPFPYYVVLRNIESLPRTLADLLRQWFELKQNFAE